MVDRFFPDEKMFCDDGSLLTFRFHAGRCFVVLSTENKFHEHRTVLEAEDLAPLLLHTMRTAPIDSHEYGPSSQELITALRAFMAVRDERGTYAR
jgi:hypothetical protein